MKVGRLILTSSAIFFLIGSFTNIYAADGSALYQSKGCSTCHGADAKTPLQPNYPKLAGQNAEYLIQQIKDIRDGNRTNGQTALMKPMTTGLTDENITAISEWLSSLE